MCIIGFVNVGPGVYNLQTIDSSGVIRDYQVIEVVDMVEPEHTPNNSL